MYDAGYDPQGMVAMFQSLIEQRRRQPSSVDQFFASHPLTEERLADTRQLIAELPAKGGLISRDPAFQDVRRRAAR
jgi:predicted Zn-dependent protease